MRALPLAALTLLAASLPPTSARAQDVDAMARWSAYTVVHYHIVGEYTDTTKILMSQQKLWRAAVVTDRVEIDFNWDQQEMKLAGTPTIKNFPSTVGTLLPVEGCPAARVDGTYEMATITAVTDMGPMILTIASTRAYPAGSIPLKGDMEPCGTAWDPVAASTVPAQDMMQVPPAMALAMPGATAYLVSPDGKSMRVKGGNTGLNATGLNDWSWTFTPTPVR